MSNSDADKAVLDSLLESEPQAITPEVAPDETVNKTPTPNESVPSPAEAFAQPELSLKDLINPEILNKIQLSNLTNEQLETLSLKELMSMVTQEAIAGPWTISQEGELQSLSAEYELDMLWRAKYLMSDLMGKACSLELFPEEMSLIKTPEDKYLLKLRLLNKTADKSNSALAFAQYVNYRVTSSDDPYANDYYADQASAKAEAHSQPTQLTEETLEAEKSLLETLSNPDSEEGYISCTSRLELLTDESDTGTKKIRLAAAKVGKWKHPVYKQVEFTQQDFTDAINNFKNRVLGFEPPLFLGHASNMVSSGGGIAYETAEGAPAEGFCTDLYTEGDVLYSEWELVNDSVYEAVKSKRYRYNSGEFVRGFKSKDDGANVGLVVVGMALTNRPFVPDLPHAKALTEQQIRPDSGSSFKLSFKEDTEEAKTSVDSEEQPASQAPDETIKSAVEPTNKDMSDQQLTEPTVELSLAQVVEKQGKELQAVKAAYEQQLAEALNQVQTLSAQVQDAQSQLKNRELNEKLSWLENLALPAEVKESYATLIKSGTLGASEPEVLKTLETTSLAFSNSVTTQQGASDETEKLNDPLYADPYKEVVERNTQIANKLREASFGIK